MARPDQRSEEAQAWRRLYKTARWQRIRRDQLQAEPLCHFCWKQGITEPATICDHVDPKSKQDETTFYAGPYQSLCRPCHDGDKQRLERGGKARIGCGVDGWPNPLHGALRAPEGGG